MIKTVAPESHNTQEIDLPYVLFAWMFLFLMEVEIIS